MATRRFTLKDFEQADSELRTVQSRTHFYIHVLMYVMANIVLVIFNLILAPAYPWALISVVIWGIALAVHYLVAFHWMDRANARWMAQAEYLAEELHRANEMVAKKVA